MNEFNLDVKCGVEDCDFEGEVTAWEDTLLGAWGWKCPDCGTEHEDDFGFDAGFLDDEDWID